MLLNFKRWSISVDLVTWINWGNTIVFLKLHFKIHWKSNSSVPPSSSQIHLFQTLLPLIIFMTLYGVGMDIFWNCTCTSQKNFATGTSNHFFLGKNPKWQKWSPELCASFQDEKLSEKENISVDRLQKDT